MLIKPVVLINFPGGLLSDWTMAMDQVGAYRHIRVRDWRLWDGSLEPEWSFADAETHATM
jgi:hypothetical protein